MRKFIVTFLAIAAASIALAQGPLGPSTLGPQHVAVIYNNKVPTSLAVAMAYVQARGIDPDRLVPLDCSTEETITRKEFRDTIQEPLRRAFSAKSWWQLERLPTGEILAVKPKVRVLTLIQGMPLRISRDDVAAQGKTGQLLVNEASVDSELMLLGAFNAPIEGGLKNPYFQKTEDFATFGETSMFLVGRIDGPDIDTAIRLATEAVGVEASGGPRGRGVIDLAGKGGSYQVGDDWLVKVFNDLWQAGFPTQIDRHPWTITDSYPIGQCAVYFGWYDATRSGFLLDPEFRFAKGAIGVHLHSFSAQSLRSPDQHWTGPLVARGATASLGNVWEPYLQLTHHFDIFNKALLDGYTLVEAAGMSIPVVSWMNVVIGDPLYRPFVRRNNIPSEKSASGPDSDWLAIQVALTRWKDDPATCAEKLRAAGKKSRNPLLIETAGLLEYRLDKQSLALKDFQDAAELYKSKQDQLRCWMLAAETHLASQKKTVALKSLRDLEKVFADLPQIKAVSQHILKLDPPPPPPPPAPKPAAADAPKPAKNQ